MIIHVINFIYHLVDWLLSAVSLCIITSAIASWLVAFNIVNPRNAFVYQILRFLDAVTAPVLAPFRRFIPLLGGVDITPLIALVLIQLVQRDLLYPAFNALANLVAG
jgi:YggT family protein